MSEVAKWYQGKNIFITGGTGLVGKSLVEKLLRDCPKIGHIYLMIRPKKCVSFEQRKLDYTNHVVFSCLKENQSNVFDKLHFIEGDLRAPNLGISDVDKKLVAETVSVFFHSAADVRFDQPLTDAYNSNVKGTEGLLKFAAQFKHIDVSRLVSNIQNDVQKIDIYVFYFFPRHCNRRLFSSRRHIHNQTILENWKKSIIHRPLSRN